MCGIAGYLLRAPGATPPLVLARLMEGIRARGPDDEGACLVLRSEGRATHLRTDRTAAGARPGKDHLLSRERSFPHDLALAATRFAIQDPSPAGHQPFESRDGSVIGVFNGEIYNFVELRQELEGHGVVFRTRCDTEVLVEGFRHWGQDLWHRMNGFWAVAVFDRAIGTVTLSRDRLGIAPLYIRETPGCTFFCSSPAPLRDMDPASLPINAGAVVGFIETELKDFGAATVYEGISALPPAVAVEFPLGQASLETARVRHYWQPPQRRLRPDDLSLEDAVTRLRDTLVDAVTLRLRSEVPTAFELSGGLDSSSIVAIAAEMTPGITTFTIEVPDQNEEPFARTMARRHRIDYRVLRETDETFPEKALEFARLMEEPFHSPNIFTHHEMRTRMKAEGVDVVLSGSGGDEVLAGYEGSFWPGAAEAMRMDGDSLAAGRHSLLMNLRHLRSWDLTRSRARRVMGRLRNLGGAGDPHSPRARAAALDDSEGDVPALALERGYPHLSYDEQRRYHFQVGLLPYYLASNDRFTMAIPIEHRFPFLDFRMVELGLLMPPSYLFRNGWTKYVLRKAMEPLLPRAITWRRNKMGFPFPLERLLRTRKATFEPYFDQCRNSGYIPAAAGYDDWLRSDPVKLWRACSTGLWLSSL
ncbi:asparagine synthase (glutamine-hydrolyzing) [soil metagenome]